MFEYCYPLGEGEILNENYETYPLFEVVIYGGKTTSMKLAKRLVCSLKHLPIRLKIHYENDIEKSIEAGALKDPALKWNEKFLTQGLVSAEELAEIFTKMLKEV